MKIIVTLIAFLFCLTEVLATDYIDRIRTNLQWTSFQNVEYHELEGYMISVEYKKINSEFTNFNKIRSKLANNSAIFNYDSIAQNQILIIRNQEVADRLNYYYSYYVKELMSKEFYIVKFSSINKIDSLLEKEFVKLLLIDSIPTECYLDIRQDSVNFVGRKFPLGKICNWMQVHNVQCRGNGQMNWSIHETFEDAKSVNDAQFVLTSEKWLSKFKFIDTVDIVFEGVETKAKRGLLKIYIPSFFLGGSNELVIYYVVAEVRGKFVSCVLSHYTDDFLFESGLPGLLNQVMKLRK